MLSNVVNTRQDESIVSVRALAEQAFSRAAGAPLAPGNHIRLLKDARENYPAWLDAIARAVRFIHFESYIIHDDAVGAQFSDVLIAKAPDGVDVRVIYDWMGGFGKTSRRFWNRLRGPTSSSMVMPEVMPRGLIVLLGPRGRAGADRPSPATPDTHSASPTHHRASVDGSRLDHRARGVGRLLALARS